MVTLYQCKLVYSYLNFLGVYVSYLLVLKQLDVKNKLADKICVAFSSKNGCNAALESSVSKLFGILL